MSKITPDQVIEPNLFKNTIDSGNELLKVLDSVEKEFREILKTTEKSMKENPLKGFADAAKLADDIKKAEVATKGLNDTQKEQAKIQKQLTQLTDEEVKGKIRFQQANNAQKDSLRDLLIIEDQEAGTLAKLEALNRQLARERKGLNLETAEGAKRVKEINAQIDSNNVKITQNSDKLKNQKRNVGNYTDSIKDAANASGLFSSQIAILNRIQATLNAVLRKNTAEKEFNSAATVQAGVAEAGQTTATVTNTVAIEANTAVSAANATATSTVATANRAAGAASGIFTKGLKAVKIALISTGIGAIVVLLGGLVAAFATTQRGADAFSRVLKPIQVIFQRLLGFFQNEGFKTFDKIKEAFSNPLQAIKDLGQAILDNVISRFQALALFGPAIAKIFKGEFVDGFTALGDATIQLTTGIENATQKITEFSNAVAKEVEESLKLADQVDKIQKRFERLQIDTTVPIAKARLEYEKLKAVAQDQLKTDQERINALKAAEKQQRFIAATEKKLLDLQIEKLKIEQTFNSTKRLGNGSELELQKLLAEKFEAEKEAQEKISGLVALRSSIEISAAAEAEKNLKVQQKLAEEAQKAAETAQELLDELEIRFTNDDTEKAILERLNKFEDEIKQIEENATLSKEQQAEISVLLAQEVANDIAKIEQDAAKKSQDLRDKELAELTKKENERIDKIKKREEAINSIVQSAVDKRAAIELRQANEEIRVREDSVKTQEDRAAQGLTNTLDFEREQLAKAQSERKSLEDQEARRELRRLFLKIALATAEEAARTGNGLKNVTIESLAKTLELDSVSKVIGGSFFEGTDSTGTVANPLDSNGGRVALLHNNERIFNEKQTATLDSLGYTTRDSTIGALKAFNMIKSGVSPQFEHAKSDISSDMIREIRNLNNTVKSKREVSIDWDTHGNMIKSVVEDAMRQTVKYVNRKPRI